MTVTTDAPHNPVRRMIHITDNRGNLLLPEAESVEPNEGSIVLTEGIFGTAWQRFFSDGRWHPTRGGGSRTWEQMLIRPRLVLVYEAEVRTTLGKIIGDE